MKYLHNLGYKEVTLEQQLEGLTFYSAFNYKAEVVEFIFTGDAVLYRTEDSNTYIYSDWEVMKQ